jgi:pilus assembly protein CpaB
MKMKSLLLLTVAAGCGLVAMLGVQQVLSGDRGEKIERVRVLVARAEIDPGVPLDKENVTFRDVPIDTVPPNPVTRPEEYEERALKSRAFGNQVICLSQLGEKGELGATINIPDGMRIATIPVNATMTHSGLMKPGDRVDVGVTYKVQVPKLGTQNRTKTILEFIEVWATDSVRVGVEENAKDSSAKAGVKNVSLLVTPNQATLLMLAKSKGDLHLTLRSKTDLAKSGSRNMDDASLESMQALFDENPERTEEPKPAEPKVGFNEFLNQPETDKDKKTDKPTWKITIFSGEKKTVEEVELPEPEPTSTTTTDASTSQGGDWVSAMGKLFGMPTGSR